jgi:monothiol glutaredoxin
MRDNRKTPPVIVDPSHIFVGFARARVSASSRLGRRHRIGDSLPRWVGFRESSPITHAGFKITMDVIERIKQTLAGHPVVLYMKGTPDFPMCGFSMRTSQALTATGAKYFSVNVLEDPEIRANLPRYSNWPTFPQLYINGELIGGCDITLELYESGELQRMVAEADKQTAAS